MKKKMRLGMLLAAGVFLTGIVRAASVSSEQAASVARAWARQGRHLSAWIGTRVASASSLTTTDGALFYVVRMADGGSVITSGDTELEPIVAFTSNTLDEEALSSEGPLYALLNSDLSMRQRSTPASGLSYGPTAYAAQRAAAATVNERKWTALVAAGVESDSLLSYGVDATYVSEPSDLRVDALMKTEWSQGDGIWNSCTYKNYICGCVATAASQVMRYLHGTPDEDGLGGLEIPFPVAEVPQLTFTCAESGKAVDLTMAGGTYEWTNMPFTASEADTLVKKRNIGKLTADVGISVNMDYSATASGAVNERTPGQLMDVFGYRQAVWLSLEDADVNETDSNGLQANTLFANFDAGRPCLMSIPGHAIVADGYGFDDELPYTHLNMGWAGSGDLWYNLPNMTEAGAKYTVVNGIGYNIFPEVGGVDDGDQTTHAVLSGRVLDDDGQPVAGCAVTVRSGDTEVTNLVTDANGIWAAILPAGAYDIEAATSDGEWIGVAEDVSLEVPVTEKFEGFGGSLFATVAAVGNSWGNDITLEHPSVRIPGVTRPYSTIDRAVAAARKLYAENPALPAVTLEIIDGTQLKTVQTIDFPCVIVATNADPYASAVTRRDGASLVVATNGFLAVSNVVFAGVNETLVSVASNGTVTVAGLVDFGVSYETAAIETTTTNGFMLASPISLGFTLKCEAARTCGEFCGIGAATTMSVFEMITNVAPKIANYYDPLGETRARVVGGPNAYALVWADLPVPLGEAVGFYIDVNGATNTAARLDKLVADYEEALSAGRLGDVRRLVVRKGGTLSRPLTVADGLMLSGEGLPVIEAAGTAGFTLTGGKLSVSGLTFTNYVGNALFLVNGETAELAISGGTVFTHVTGTNKWSGAITVLKGVATIGGDSRFEACEASGKYAANRNPCNAYGGALYLEAGCTGKLAGCTMTGCTAKNYGGAVYAETGSVVRLSGALNIVGNVDSLGQTKSQSSDICLKNSEKGAASLVLDGVVSGEVGVRWKNIYGGFGYKSGDWLATATNEVYTHESAKAFVNDVNESLVAEPVEDGEICGLRWTDTPTGPQPCDPAVASARVTYAAGGDSVYYLLVSEALEVLTNDATVAIIGWNGCYIDSDLTLTNRVTLQSDTDIGYYAVERRGNCSFKIGIGASLTLRDVAIRGCEMTNSLEAVGELLRAKPDEWTSVPVFDVAGGTLTLAEPSDTDQYETAIEHVYGDNARAAGAVRVTDGGVFTIETGAILRGCINRKADEADGTGRGGAVLVDDGIANLAGGAITNCCAYNGGGVFVGSHGAVNVSGDCKIVGNTNLHGEDDNLYVSDTSELVLTSVLTGRIGYTGGVRKDVVVFGCVATNFAGTAVQVVASAHNFTNDKTGDVGLVATNGADRLLVWGAALAADGTYTNAEGAVYAVDAGNGTHGLAVPTARMLVYDGTEQIGVAAIDCLVSDNIGTMAGTYAAKVTPRPGFSWKDTGTTETRTVSWSIAKAVYDMSSVLFEDKTVIYTGKTYELTISGELPAGVTVAYANNRRSELGEQLATAIFSGDTVNYELIPNRTATLKVENAPDYPPIPPGSSDPEYAEPTPISFKSISRVSDTEWALVITDRVQWAEYRLIWTDDLTKGFTTTGTWEQATVSGAWTTNVLFAAPVPSAIFWKAEAQKGEKK